MTYLLDTSVLIDALNDRRSRAALLEELLLQDHSLGCCAVNVTEVFAGIRPIEQARTEELLNKPRLLRSHLGNRQTGGASETRLGAQRDHAFGF